MSEILKNLDLTFEVLNSTNKEVRREARKKLAESYPTLKVIAEVTSEKKKTFPVTVNGFQCFYPINNMLSCSTIYNSANESSFRIVGFKGEENAKSITKTTKLSDLAKKANSEIVVTPIVVEPITETPENGGEVIENTAEVMTENGAEITENKREGILEGAEVVAEKPKKTRKV